MNIPFFNWVMICFVAIIIFALTGCSTSMGDKRKNIIEELQDSGCIIQTYQERFERSIFIKCSSSVVGDSL